MPPPQGINPGDTVVELAALANSTAIVCGAVVGAWLTALAKRGLSASALGFVCGASVGLVVGQTIARTLYRGNGNTLIVKAGAGSLHATIPAGITAGLLAALSVCLLVWLVFGGRIPVLSFLGIALGCGVVIGIAMAFLGSLA